MKSKLELNIFKFFCENDNKIKMWEKTKKSNKAVPGLMHENVFHTEKHVIIGFQF